MKSNDSNKPSGNAPSTPVVSRLRRVIDMSDIKDTGTKSAGGKFKPHSGPKQERREGTPKDQHKKRVKAPNAPKKQNNPQPQQAAPKMKAPVPPADPTTASQPAAEQQPAPQIQANPPQAQAAPIRKSSAAHLKVTRSLKATGKHQSLHFSDKRLHSRERIKTPKFLAKKLKSEPVYARPNQADDKIHEALLLQSWHAKKWVSSIAELSSSVADQLLKSMPIVQARLINNLNITCGKIEATVVDQVTTISLRQFTSGQWRVVINMLSDRAIFTTSLLNGELPEGIQDIFKQASLSLFPGKMKEFSFECDCQSKMPCEHASALLLAFAIELEEDPSLILTLRGMPRDELLSQLRDARSDQVVDEKSKNHYNYELPAQNVDFANFYVSNGDFKDMSFHIANTQNTLLKRLGTPSEWHATIPFESAISPIIEAASREAEALSLSEKPEMAIPEDQPSQKPMSRAPKNSAKAPKFTMPDLEFITQKLTPEILETITDDPVTTAEDIIRWLKTRGASDIRTLARRTRLHKPTIEAFLNAFCDAGLTVVDGEDDKRKFSVTF